MKRITPALIFYFLFVCLLNVAVGQQYQYTFNNSLSEFSGGPALTQTLSCGAASGTFTPGQVITTTSGTCSGTATVFSFNSGGGLLFSNNPSVISSSYTIHVFFKFIPFTGGYARIIDFSNSTSDAGIYILNNCLNFYPNGNVGPCPNFVDGNYYLISLVRDAATNVIKVYVNGTVFSTYTDASGTYIPPTPTTPIIFFRDDNSVPCETRPGNVKYISLSPAVSSDGQVAAVFSNICTNIALPVTLTSFNANKLTPSNVSLTWTTVQENNISSYEIERSIDGITFETIGHVNASGTSTNLSHNYQFTDVAPATGTNYYRIKIISRDNSAKYSAVKIINNNRTSLTISPNPATDVLKINFTAASATKVLFTISDASGRQLKNLPVLVSAGMNNISIDVAKLAAGTYVVKFDIDGNSSIQKFTKR